MTPFSTVYSFVDRDMMMRYYPSFAIGHTYTYSHTFSKQVDGSAHQGIQESEEDDQPESPVIVVHLAGSDSEDSFNASDYEDMDGWEDDDASDDEELLDIDEMYYR